MSLKKLASTVIFAALCGHASAQTISFSISPDTFATTVQGINAGVSEPLNEYTVGILFNITAYNGQGLDSPLVVMGFCSEIGQPISAGTAYTLNYVPLSQLASHDASSVGGDPPASHGIPTGGIGELAAARVGYLYDNFYAGTSATDWVRTDLTPDTLAFQIAQWEITHDSDLTLDTGATSNMWIDALANASDPRRAGTIALAEAWLTQIRDADVTTDYQATNYDLIGITSPEFQDVIIATEKGLLVVPEPSGVALLGLTGVIACLRRRRIG